MSNSTNDCIAEIARLKQENDILKGIIGESICVQLQEAKLPFNGTEEWVNNVIDINSELEDLGLGVNIDYTNETDADGNRYNRELYVSIKNGGTSIDDLYGQISSFLDNKPKKGTSR